MILNQSSMTSQKVPKFETQVSNMRSHPSALPSRVFKGTFLRNTWCKDLEGPHPSYVRRPGLMLARIRLVTFNGLVLEDRAGGRLEKASTSPIEEELVAGPPRTLNKVKLATCHTGGPARAGSRVVVTFFISMKKIRQNTRWRRLILHTRRGVAGFVFFRYIFTGYTGYILWECIWKSKPSLLFCCRVGNLLVSKSLFVKRLVLCLKADLDFVEQTFE